MREVDGIGPVRAQRITAARAEQKIVREIMVSPTATASEPPVPFGFTRPTVLMPSRS
jgi:hypothetical protein